MVSHNARQGVSENLFNKMRSTGKDVGSCNGASPLLSVGILYFTLSDALSSMTLGKVCYSNCDRLIGQTNAIEWSNSMRLDGQARAITHFCTTLAPLWLVPARPMLTISRCRPACSNWPTICPPSRIWAAVPFTCWGSRGGHAQHHNLRLVRACEASGGVDDGSSGYYCSAHHMDKRRLLQNS